ncbi:MAG: nucleotidyltransferase family protein [Candidatus Aenigmarchaeota archaeon]|nr:nucleotidyltransferase family protein [Candidatus Aenigmarchaeota archaeon]
MGIERVTITIEEELLRKVDQRVKSGKAKSRSHALNLIMNSYFGQHSSIPAIILLGGEKQYFMKKIDGEEILKQIVNWLKNEGISRTIVTVNQSNFQLVKNLVGEQEIEIIPESSPLGTAGAIKQFRDQLKETFLVVYGDVHFKINLEEFLKFHRENGGVITMALSSVKDPGKFGVVKVSGSQVVEFVEKPKTSSTYLINAGVFLMEPSVFHYYPTKSKISLETEIFPSVAKDGKLFGYLLSHEWVDVGKL